MNFQTMSKQRKFVLLSAALGVLSMFLPWISISVLGFTQSVNGMHDKGIIVFVCFLVAGAVAYMGDQQRNMDRNSWTVSLAAGALALLLIAWFYFQTGDSILGSDLIGFGMYLAAIAAAGVLVCTFMFRTPGDTIRDGFGGLKNAIENRIHTKPQDSPPTPTATTDTSTPTPNEQPLV